MRRLAQTMIGYYGQNDVASMEFRLLWEVDNPDNWNPRNGRTPFDEFKLLWSETVAGLNSGGIIRPILNPSNLTIAYSSNGRISWLNDLAAFLQQQTNSVNINRFSFSLYGELSQTLYPQLGGLPSNLVVFAEQIRNILRTRFPTAEISVDEGGLIGDENGVRMFGLEGTEVGAAWNAMIMKHAMNNNWKYYAGWFYSSDGTADGGTIYQGVKNPSYFVMSMFELLKDGKRLPESYLNIPTDRALQTVAAVKPDGRLGAMVINYNPNRAFQATREYKLVINNLRPNTKYYVKQYRVDRDHANYTKDWLSEFDRWGMKFRQSSVPYTKYDAFSSSFLSDNASDILPGAPYPTPKAFWAAQRDNYDYRMVFSHANSGGSQVVTSNGTGTLELVFNLLPNAVSYFDILAFQSHDSFGNSYTQRSIYPNSNKFTSDNFSDLAAAGVHGWGSIPVAMSLGDGSFNTLNLGISNFPALASTPYSRILVGNFGGDNLTDLAVAGGLGWNAIHLAINKGTQNPGLFESQSRNISAYSIVTKMISDPRSKVFIGKWNSDALDDIIVLGSPDAPGILVAYRLDGDIRWFQRTNRTQEAEFVKHASHPSAKILAGNFDGDVNGLTDFVIIGIPGLNTIPIALGTQNGIFNCLNLQSGDFASWAAHPSAEVLVGDFDGDGDSNLAITGVPGWGSVPVAKSNRNGTFEIVNTGVQNFPSWATVPSAKFVVGDFNGDRRTDIAITGVSGWFSIPVIQGRIDGSWNFVNMGLANFPSYSATPGVITSLGDYNGDGRMDIALTGVSGWSTIPVAFGNVNGSFTETNKYVQDFPSFTPAVIPR